MNTVSKPAIHCAILDAKFFFHGQMVAACCTGICVFIGFYPTYSIKRSISTRQLVYCYNACSFFLLADVDTRCKEFDNGTSLHIAASNLCLEGAKCLVRAH